MKWNPGLYPACRLVSASVLCPAWSGRGRRWEQTWLVFIWMRGQMWSRPCSCTGKNEAQPQCWWVWCTAKSFFLNSETSKSVRFLFFSPKCESETRGHLAHLRFARLGLVEQQRFCSMMTWTVTAWGNKLILLLKSPVSSSFYLQALKKK